MITRTYERTVSTQDYIKNKVSNLYNPFKSKKKIAFKIQGLTLPLLASACGGGTTGGEAEPVTSAPATEAVSFVETTDNVFIASSDEDLTLDVSSTPQAVTVNSSSGDDTIITGSGDDVIRAGDGADTVEGGDGDDTIVLVGTTSSGQYSASSITNSAGGADLSDVITEDDLNNNTVSEVGAGEVIDGGSGNDSLVIYGTAYINQATLRNLDEMWINSEVILTGEQFAEFGAFKGDGSSIIRVRADYLDPVTSENDDNKGGNKGHGNNSDGQDDDNPGQGKGGPNFKDKDGIDEDEEGGGNPNQDWDDTPIGGETTEEATIVDISDIYMANIGVLSLEGLITLIADDMHDFAGITNVNGDGSTKIILNGDDDVDVTTFDLSAINLSGIAELDLTGNFNLIVSDPNDYFGIGTIAVNNSADITLTLDNTANPGANYDFSSSPLFAVDHVKTYGDTKITFDQLSDIDDTIFTPVTGELYVAIHAPIDGETVITGAEIAAHFGALDTLELQENVKIIISAENAMTDVGALRIIGHGTIEIDRTGLSDEQIIEIISAHEVDLTINVVDQDGNDLYALLPTSIVEGTPENDIYVGENGESVYKFTPVSNSFGNDTVQNFEIAYDKIDISDTLINFNEITQTVNASGLLIETEQGSILIEGLTEALTVDFFILHDTSAPVLESFSLSTSVNMDDSGYVQISMAANDADSSIETAIITFNTPAGGTLDVEMTSLNGAFVRFYDDLFDEEGIYTLSHITLTDSNLNVAEIPALEINANTEMLVVNSEATNESNILRGDENANVLEGTNNDDIILPRAGDDTLTGGDGNDTYMYFNNDFGVDKITDFAEGDIIDFTATTLSEGNFKIFYRENSLEMHYGENKLILDNFDGVLTNIGTYSDPVFTVMSEEARLDANHIGDIRPPSINEIDVPEVVNLDENTRFYFNLDVSDDISGAERVRLQYKAEDGSYFYIQGHVNYDFEGWQSLNEWFMPGTYELVYIWGQDSADNYFHYHINELEALGISSTIEITNSNPDILDPIVHNISLDKTTIDLSTNDEIFITVDATDDMSGVDHVYIRFHGPYNQYEHVYLYPEQGLIRKIDINKYFGSGEYNIDYIKIRDNAGQEHIYTGSAITEAGLDTSFEIINPNEDITAPNITDISAPNGDQYIIGVEDDFSILVTTDENHSGVYSGYIQLIDPTGINKTVYLNNRIDLSNIESSPINADQWIEGTYSVSFIQLSDRGENYKYTNSSELSNNGIDFTFDVIAPLKIYGTVENDLLIGGEGHDHFIFGSNFGNDTIEAFTLGEDYINLEALAVNYGDISQSINEHGLLLEIGDNSIQINGLTDELDSKYIVGDNQTPSNNSAPTLNSFNVLNNEINVDNSDTIIATINIDDIDANASRAYVRFRSDNGKFITINLHESNDFTISYELNEYTHSGTYNLDYIWIIDKEGASTTYQSGDLTALGISESITVINSREDFTAPEITGFTISTNSIEVGIENVINFQATGSDDLSGIHSFSINIGKPDSTEYFGIGLSETNQFNGGTFFSDWSDIGTYTINSITVYDKNFNATLYNTDDLDLLGFQTTFEVTDAKFDDIAPVLEDISLDQPYVDSENYLLDTMTINFTVTETGSGLNRINYSIKNEETGSTFTLYSYNSLASNFYKYNTDAGIYKINTIYISDIAKNSITYLEEDLDAQGFDLTFRVLGDGPQPGVEVSGTGEIDTIVGTTADEVFTLHLGEDTLEFGADWGHDTILDFIQGDDVLDFTATGLIYADLDTYDTSYGLFIYDESTGSDLLFQNFFGELKAGDALFATTHGTDENDVLTTTELVHLNTGLGDDTVSIIHDQFNQIDGGEGYDTIAINTDDLDGVADIIDLSPLTQRDALKNIEAIDLSNGEADEIQLSVTDVISMTDADNILVLEGDADDTFNIAGKGWTENGTSNLNGTDYDVYISGDATLFIDQEMSVI